MAKSIRSKVKRRFRTAKRGVVKRTVSEDRAKPILKTLERAGDGMLDMEAKKRNAFRSDEPDAIYPQHTFTPCTDFRSENVVEARYAMSGNRRVTHPLHMLEGTDGEGGVLSFGPGGGALLEADEEVMTEATEPKPFEDDRMNYDGSAKQSSRERRRNRNKKSPAAAMDSPGGQFSFWSNKQRTR
jgi:hypothetical protein